jgi:membrane-bound lytic murein transglycosylase A
MRSLGVLLFFLFLLSASGGNSQAQLGDLVFHDDLDRESLRHAIHHSLEFLSKLPPDRPVGEYPRKVTAREVGDSLFAFMELLDHRDRPEKFAQEIRSRFELYPSVSAPVDDEVLFTGYYQPVVDGSLSETREFSFPVYGKPRDLIVGEMVTLAPQLRTEKLVGRLEGDQLVSYYSRYEIDGLERLKGKGYEIAWVKDPVELFFLHIQGSGLLRLEDGRRLYLNYAASNGRPYTGIGKLLIDDRKILEDEMTMQRLRRYLMEHPDERDALFARNQSYVFFRFGNTGPLGNLDVPLTPGRSIATDSRLFPKGALAFVVSRKPIFDSTGNLVTWQPFSRFVLNQDTGSGIRGRKRVDLYFGSGHEAGQAAGVMKSAGTVYFLIKKKTRPD